LQKFDAALSDYDTYTLLSPRDSRALIARSTVMEALGRTKGALIDLDRALTRDPTNAQARAARDRLAAQQNAQQNADDPPK
jgi:tetratricopeptide (TPR) repeat protein